MMQDGDRGDGTKLSETELDLVHAVASGRRANLHGHSVRAEVVRMLVTEENPEWRLPHNGINIHGATIEGLLDLESCTLDKPLVFLHCKFKPHHEERAAISLRDGRFKRIGLYDCTIEGAFKADRVQVDTALFLTSSTFHGMVRLRGASVGEALAMDEMQVHDAGEIAVLADGLNLGGPWVMRGASIKGEVRFSGAVIAGALLWEEVKLVSEGRAVALNADGAQCKGTWVLRRADITGPFRARGLAVKAIDGINLRISASGEGLNLRGADLSSDLTLETAHVSGGISLTRARVLGEVSLRGADVSGPRSEWAVAAGGVDIRQGLNLTGSVINGGMTLAGAQIGQGIVASNMTITGEGRAIEADVVQLGGNWIMRGANVTGSIRFAGATIEGQVGFTASKIKSDGDLAIRADGARVRGGWFMGRAEIDGLVRLPAARLGNELRLRGTHIRVSGGPALFANGLRVQRDIVLDEGFSATGAITFDHAHVDGMVDLTGSRISSAKLARDDAPISRNYDALLDERYDEAAFSLVDGRADRLVMPATAASRMRGVVDLSRANVGSFEDQAGGWPPPVRARKGDVRGRTRDGRDIDHLVLDGFIYEHMENPSGLVGAAKASSSGRESAARMRTRWLEGQSEQDLIRRFKPQAWMQVAKKLRSQGYQDDARELAIARRRRQRKGGSSSWPAKLQGWVLDVFALYGFNPWRTVTWMGAFVILFAGVWGLAAAGCSRSDCKDETVFVMALKGNYGQNDRRSAENYPPFSSLAYSFDVFVPFVNFGFEEHWRPRITYGDAVDVAVPGLPGTSIELPTVRFTTGTLLYGVFVLETVLGLLLTSLAVTGFTGLLNSSEDQG